MKITYFESETLLPLVIEIGEWLKNRPDVIIVHVVRSYIGTRVGETIYYKEPDITAQTAKIPDEMIKMCAIDLLHESDIDPTPWLSSEICGLLVKMGLWVRDYNKKI